MLLYLNKWLPLIHLCSGPKILKEAEIDKGAFFFDKRKSFS